MPRWKCVITRGALSMKVQSWRAIIPHADNDTGLARGEIEEREYDEADNDYTFCDALRFYVMQI